MLYCLWMPLFVFANGRTDSVSLYLRVRQTSRWPLLPLEAKLRYFCPSCLHTYCPHGKAQRMMRICSYDRDHGAKDDSFGIALHISRPTGMKRASSVESEHITDKSPATGGSSWVPDPRARTRYLAETCRNTTREAGFLVCSVDSVTQVRTFSIDFSCIAWLTFILETQAHV